MQGGFNVATCSRPAKNELSIFKLNINKISGGKQKLYKIMFAIIVAKLVKV